MDIYGLRNFVPTCLKSGDFSSLWEKIFLIHRLKSGFPASMSARIGIVLGNGTREQEDVVGNYFLALGLAFQIMDDVINLRGFRGLKTRAEDLREGKLTTPVVRALNVLGENERIALCQHMGLTGGAIDVDAAMKLIDDCRALDWCIQHSSELVENAWKDVDRILPDSFSKVMLRSFGWFVVHVRDY
jgi:geranylgeranyl pyrophosphate synthase